MRKTRTIKLDISELKEAIGYDPNAGVFTWLKTGRLAGGIKKNKNGTWYQIGYKGERYAGTHLAWVIMTGTYPVNRIGTNDGNPLNLKWDNLFEDTDEIIRRSRKTQRNSTTQIPGVCYRKDRDAYQAVIHADGDQIYLGSGSTIEEATTLRRNAEALLDYRPR